MGPVQDRSPQGSGQWLRNHARFPQRGKLARPAPRSPLAKPRGTVLARRSTGFFNHWPSPYPQDILLRAGGD
jgi:hypothetical protein